MNRYEDEKLFNERIEDPVKKLLDAKAAELFAKCDLDDKGFINKQDIQRLRHVFGILPEELEIIFEELDVDKNGYLTLEEFAKGFESVMKSELESEISQRAEELNLRVASKNSSYDLSNNTEVDTGETELEADDESFEDVMFHLGATEFVENCEIDVKQLWLRFKNEKNQEMLKSFELFIENAAREIKKTKNENYHLESVLHSKRNIYDEQSDKLYEEMELQIKAETARILEQEKKKEKELKDKLLKDLSDKESQLQESLTKQHEMEQNLLKLNIIEHQQKQEKEKLLREKMMLEERLQETTKNVLDYKAYINNLQQQTKVENINRATMALTQTNNIIIEKEKLLRELNELREAHKKVQDERDELMLQIPEHNKNDRINNKRESILASYIYNPRGVSFDEPNSMNTSLALRNEAEMYDDSSFHEESEDNSSQESIKIVVPSAFHNGTSQATTSYSLPDIMNVPSNATPERVFKIILIGDSGVGKTSFMQRFCNDRFNDLFSTTIGVDFQVKLIKIDNRIIALQLWDTAGQERFRSITKQYFRKADGVICMYDVTSEQSFKSLRNWIFSIKEGASSECLISVIGNKVDLCKADSTRVVKHKDGADFAKEEGTLFFETSSKLNRNIVESMEAIARILQDKEDKQIEDVLNLRTNEKKRKCC